MVDRTKYDAALVPELALRQIFGRQRLQEDLCRVVADRKLLTVEAFAMLGDTIAAVKESLKVIIADEALLGASPGERELALTSLAAVWKTCSTLQDHFAARRAKMEEDPSKVPEIPGDDHAEFREQFVARHPDVLLPHHREPHRKLVERLQRDFLVHGSVPFYEVGELRTRSEQIAQKSGLSKNAEDLLKVVTIDQPTTAASETQVMDKLHAFLVALEYLNICEFTYAAGPLRYLSELEEWRHENHGLALLLSVDSLIRRKVYIVSMRITASRSALFPVRSMKFSPTTSSSGMTLGPVQSWRSSSKRVTSRLQQHLHAGGPSVTARTRLRKGCLRLEQRRTRLVGIVQRRLSKPLVTI